MDEQILVVPPTLDGERLDKAIVSLNGDLTRSSVQKLIELRQVYVNGVPAVKSSKVSAGEEIVFSLPDPVELEAVAQDIPIEIVYEDACLLVVNKPKGMVVHPAAGNPDGTLVNALLHHCRGRLSSVNGVIRPGIVHRIDKDTSGLLIVAKTDEAHLFLSRQIQAHSFKREYRGVVTGHLKQTSGTVDLPLGRCGADRKKQAVNGLNARFAVTHYEVLQSLRGYDHCKFTLETGRTHQIRVHMSALGHPLAGDTVYGGKADAMLSGQCLHAAVIGFVHPHTREYMEFSSPLPPYYEAFLEKNK
ncbi:MAG: RluA family pseudouridine synthase [Clostridia bacterium]|nr:RluA family pseudouridine synthase [Clostridia bacterium]